MGSAELWAAFASVIITIVGCAVWFSWRVGVAMTKFEMIGSQQASEISSIKTAIEKTEITLSAIAVDRERLDGLRRQYDDRFKMHDTLISEIRRDINDLRRGRGLIKNSENSVS